MTQTDAKPEDSPSAEPATPSPPVIELRDVSRVFPMGAYEVHAIRDIDLRIDEGDYVAIIGPSGSGKSTLMYLMGCLDTTRQGSYRFCGQEVSRLDDRRRSSVRNEQVGFVFQQFYLLSELDVSENIALGLTYAGQPRRVRQAKARDLAERVGLGHRLQHKPMELSAGQMQRVAIARALVGQPRILLADEPTGNLDSQTSDEILELIGQLNAEGMTIILVTHDTRVAQQARRIVKVVDGRIVSDERLNGLPSPVARPAAQRAPRSVLSGLRLRDLLKMSLREGLLAHKLRSMLTMLGIIFGIAAVIAMTAITEGGKQQQLEQLRQIGMNNIQVRDLDLEAARLVRERRLNPRGITLDDLEHIRGHVPGIVAASAWKSVVAEVRHGSAVVEDANTVGLAGDFQSVVNFHVGRGRFIDDVDQKQFRRICAIGPEIAEELELGDEPLGKVVIIGDQPFVVVGVMERKAFTASQIADISITNRNRDVYVPYHIMRLYFPKDSRASELDVISLRMDSDARLLEQSEFIKYIVSDLHTEAEDFGVFVPLEKLKQAQQTKKVFNVIIVVIAGISLVVGGIGIMNIMLATVTERTREIGIRRAVGASRGNIMRQFLAESLLIALFGGVLGIFAGLAGGLIVQQIFGFPVAFKLAIMAVATIVSMVVGVGFGIYPAWLAANMDPVEALRT